MSKLKVVSRGKPLIRSAKLVPMAKKLNKRQKNEVKRLIGMKLESKYIDALNVAYTGVTNAGSVVAMTYPSQGAGTAQRTGDSIDIRSIEIRYSFTGYDSSNVCRIIVFKWLNDSGVATPTAGYVVDSSWLGADTAPHALYNYTSIKQREIAICYDRVISLSNNNNAALPGNSVISGRILLTGKKLHKKKLTFTTGAVTGEGQYYVLVISDSAIVGHPKYNLAGRITYSDA